MDLYIRGRKRIREAPFHLFSKCFSSVKVIKLSSHLLSLGASHLKRPREAPLSARQPWPRGRDGPLRQRLATPLDPAVDYLSITTSRFYFKYCQHDFKYTTNVNK